MDGAEREIGSAIAAIRFVLLVAKYALDEHQELRSPRELFARLVELEGGGDQACRARF